MDSEASQYKMVGWHHQLNGHASEQAAGGIEGQRCLVSHSPWGHKELDMTERPNNSNGKNGVQGKTPVDRTGMNKTEIFNQRSCVNLLTLPHVTPRK